MLEFLVAGTRASRQHESARHYLHKPQEDIALPATVALIGERFEFPVVQVNILDGTEQHTIAAGGMTLSARPREGSSCDQVVRDGEPKQLADLDPQLSAASQWRAYVGVPIAGREGLVIGALCLLDTVPRTFDDAHLKQLVLASTVVKDQLELLRRLEPTAAATHAEARA